MSRRSHTCVLLWIIFPAAVATAADRLNVAVQTSATTCYVGEAVQIAVRVDASKTPTIFEAVTSEHFSILRINTERESIVDHGKDAITARYRVVPRRTGTLTIPGFRVRDGVAKGVSPAVKLMVKPTPTAGRPAEFLGGIGAFSLSAEAEPATVRAGEAIEYRVTIRGPGALGVNGAPDLSRLDRLPLGLHVERRPDVTSDVPPAHSFVYRLRATRAGASILPPVRIAAFDPKAGAYVTKTTAGVPIKVVDVPRFDPAKLVLPVEPRPPSRPIVGPIVVAVAARQRGGPDELVSTSDSTFTRAGGESVGRRSSGSVDNATPPRQDARLPRRSRSI